MQRGVVAKQGSIISGGKYFGEDIILQAGRRTYTVRALTFTDLFILRKDDLFKILDSANYFGIADQIRRAALCESFKGTFIRLAHLKAGITSKFTAVDEPQQGVGSRPGSAQSRGRAKVNQNQGPASSHQRDIAREAEREINISRKTSDKQMAPIASPSQQQIVPMGGSGIQSPSPGRRKSVQASSGNRGNNTMAGASYSRSKPPRILEMLQSRHDELVQAIRGLAQRSDRRADSIEDRMNSMTSNAMMGLVLMCILLAGMCVGLLVTGN
jgi:hypothetical protein